MERTNISLALKAAIASFVLACATALCVALPGQALAATWDGSSDTSWYNDTDTEFTIDTAEELAGLAAIANEGNTFANKKIILGSDIDLGGKTWTPIASFAGEFDGNGKTISDFHIDATAESAGFFKIIEAGDGERVHDLTLSDVTATVGQYRFGTLANYIKGIVNDVTVKNITVTTTHTSAWVGGMCAFMSWPWMNNCTVENLEVKAEAGADLIAGFAPILQKNSNMVFDNLDVDGFKVVVSDTDSSGCGVAGFVGQTQRGWEYPKVINCDVSDIDIAANGLVDTAGFIAWPGAHTTAENCSTQGKIDATGVTSDGCFAGGFFGNLGWNADLGQMGHNLSDCVADVDITTKVAPAGGFVGSATNSNNSSMYATFNNCSALGDVSCVAGGTADVGGFAGDADRGDYNDCTASGKVTNEGTGDAGQFIGAILDTAPKYDSRYPAGTRDYLVDVLSFEECAYLGSSDHEFFGNVADSKPAEKMVVSNNPTVYYNANGGSAVVSETVAAGETFAEPTAPTRDGYTFAGWFTDAELTQAYDFTTEAEGDITLYAKWTEIAAPEEPGTSDSDEQGGVADSNSGAVGGSDSETDSDSKESEKTSTPKTGDATPFAALGFGVVALIAAGALVATRKVL